MSSWRQLSIVHLTDVHFGERHAFQPPLPPDGHRSVAAGWPKLLESLSRDWTFGTFADRGAPPTPSGFPPSAIQAMGGLILNTRVIVAITGDLTETARDTEFADAAEFVRGCGKATITGWQMTPADVFVVPGNHDLQWTEATPTGRWLGFSNFYGALIGKHIDPAKPQRPLRAICGRPPPCKAFEQRFDQIACVHMSGLLSRRT